MSPQDDTDSKYDDLDPRWAQRRDKGEDDETDVDQSHHKKNAKHRSDNDDGRDDDEEEGGKDKDKGDDHDDKEDDDEDKKKKQMSPARKRLVIICVVIVLLLLALGGLLWWLHARHYETTDDAFIDVHIVHLSSQVSGRVLTVDAHDNEEVKAGDLLVEIDPSDYQAKLDNARATQASAAAGLLQAEAQKSSAEANVEELQSEIAVAAANAHNATSQLKRNRPLAEDKVIAFQQLDTYTANAKSAAANLDAARKKEAAGEEQVRVADSQIEAAKANQASADADMETATLNYSYTYVLAPQDGHITQKTVAKGDYISPGQTLLTLVPNEVWVTANYKETQIARMRPGQRAEIRIDAYPDLVFLGHVDTIQNGGGAAFTLLPPENATGNYVKIVQRVPVKILFDDPTNLALPLGPGMSVVPTVTVRP